MEEGQFGALVDAITKYMAENAKVEDAPVRIPVHAPHGEMH